LDRKSDRDSFHERLTAALEAEDRDRLARELAEARAADIAESFDLLNDEERSEVLFALPPHTAAEVVVMLDEAVRGDVVDDLDTESLTEMVSELPPDDAADVLGELSDKEAEAILDHMVDEKKSDKIEELLEYGEETAGGIMTPDIVAVPATAAVADAIQHVRVATQEEDLHEVYIVDDDRRPVGMVPLRRLVTNDPETKLAEICDRDPVIVFAEDDQETVIQIIRKYDAMEAVVVDADGRLLGRITHDDLLDVAEEEAAEDLLRMAGTDMAELETSSVFQAARIRLTWLIPCMVGMMLTAGVMMISNDYFFDAALFVVLVPFVPLIAAMGGNSGVQISTVIVRGFATGELASTKLLRALLREGRIALAMAPVCGVAAWALVAVSLPLFGSDAGGDASGVDHERVAIAVGTAMTSAILVAAVLGISLPFTFRRLGVDPAIASGPLVTTMNDVVSVSIYMTLAMLIAR
jgi:magnesium transporter